MQKSDTRFFSARLFEALDTVPLASSIGAVAELHGSAVYLTGGFIRDTLLGKPSARDLDLTVSGDAADMAVAFAHKISGALVALDPERGIYRVAKKIDGRLWYWDFTSLFGATIVEDLHRRDFTINAVALAIIPRGDKLLDPTGGLDDLSERIIRHTNEEALAADPIRRLRAFRLAAQLEFAIHPATKKLLPWKDLTGSTSGERIRDELAALLSAEKSHAATRDLIQSGLLNSLWPPGGPDLFCLSRFEEYVCSLFHASEKAHLMTGFLTTQSTHAIENRTLLKMVCLALTQNASPREKLDEAAARLESFARALIIGRKAETFLMSSIRALSYHYSHHESMNVPEAWWDFFDSFGQAGIGSCILYKILGFPDGSFPVDPEEISRFYYRRYLPDLKKSNLISAEEVCRLTGILPGPALGKLLKRLTHARRTNVITTPEEAAEYAIKLQRG